MASSPLVRFRAEEEVRAEAAALSQGHRETLSSAALVALARRPTLSLPHDSSSFLQIATELCHDPCSKRVDALSFLQCSIYCSPSANWMCCDARILPTW